MDTGPDGPDFIQVPNAFIDIVGQGWTFPFQFDPRTGGVSRDPPPSIVQRLQRILYSLQQILGVKLGSMFMSRKFGSAIRTLLFKPNDASLVGLLQYAVTTAIETWEKRIQLNNVSVTPDPVVIGRVNVGVDYTIRQTYVQGNLVYPLYLPDATRPVAEVPLQ